MIDLEISLARLEEEYSKLEMQYDDLYSAHIELQSKYDKLLLRLACEDEKPSSL